MVCVTFFFFFFCVNQAVWPSYLQNILSIFFCIGVYCIILYFLNVLVVYDLPVNKDEIVVEFLFLFEGKEVGYSEVIHWFD